MGLLNILNGNIKGEKQLAVKKDKSVQRIIDEYVKYQKKVDYYTPYAETNKDKLDFCVTPGAIETFLSKYGKTWQLSFHTGKFCTMLVQNSYNQGHNDFNLPVLFEQKDVPLRFLYSFLVGTKDNPIKLTIEGDHPFTLANNCVNSEITFEGEGAYDSAYGCINSKIVFNKDGSYDNAQYLNGCEVYFYGKLGWDCGKKSKNSKFYSPHRDFLRHMNHESDLKDCQLYLLKNQKKPKRASYYIH